MGNKLLIILIVGILIRLVLALSTFHSDLKAFHLSGYIFNQGYILDLYDYHRYNAEQDLWRIAVLNYPPLIYIFHGVFNFIYNILGLGFINDFVFTYVEHATDASFNIYLMLIKLPYLIFDIPIAYLLTKLFEGRREKILAFTLWMFNPVNLHATYMMGQYDVIPVFFVVLSLLLAKQKKPELSALSLGFGAAFKIFPLFLLIPLALCEKSFLDKVKLIILGLIPYLVSILIYLPSQGFRETALLANQSLKSFYVNIPISGNEYLLLFPLLLFFIYFALNYAKKLEIELWKSYLIALLPFFILTHFHPQWFLWLTPLLFIELINSNNRHLLLVATLFLSWFGSLFFFGPTLNINLFAPVWKELQNLPDWWILLGITVDEVFLRSMLQSIFSAAAIFYIFKYLPRTHDENS